METSTAKLARLIAAPAAIFVLFLCLFGVYYYMHHYTPGGGLSAVPGICQKTGTRLADQAFISAALSDSAVGDKSISAKANDGSYRRFDYRLWDSVDHYLSEHPDCCEIYNGPAGDWFTPPDKIAELVGQEGRVVRFSRPRVEVTGNQVAIGYRISYFVFDDCANKVEQ